MSSESNAMGSPTMPLRKPAEPSAYRPLRIWPACLLLLAMAVARMIPASVDEGPAMLWMIPAFVPLLCSLLLIVWWIAISRARWNERLLGFVGVMAAAATAILFSDISMRGPATTYIIIPMGTAAFGVGAVLFSRKLSLQRTVIAVLLAFCGFGYSTLLRADGIWGNFSLGLHWRWEPSAEQQLLASHRTPDSSAIQKLPAGELDRAISYPEWPGFRGADRTGRQTGMQFASDWTAQPLEPIWKINVGPGWSSFAVAGNLLFTQEQRGPDEAVVCYDADSGKEYWIREVKSRLEDPLGGPGPRATPTLASGKLFAMGAEGILLCLEPRTGEVIWQNDLRKVAERSPPMWGFCSSPLVVDQLVIVHAGGAGDKGVLAFDIQSGELRWSVASADHTYSSPQLCRVAGEDFVTMVTNRGLELLDPATGSQRLDYQWQSEGYRSLQPLIVESDSILIATGMGMGTRRIRIVNAENSLATEELWTSRQLKPDFNDFVTFQGHIYGFDGDIFTCVSLDTGERKWKGGRYGKGQVLLLEDSGLLLIASEQGDVLLVKADPASRQELAKMKALEGKTWNHPVVVGDRLFIRNSEQAAAFRMPLFSGERQAAVDGGPASGL